MSRLKAVIIDLSGVIANTNKLHQDSWEEVLSDFFSYRKRNLSFHEEDYYNYFYRKNKYDRVKNFLDAKKIKLPIGHKDDPSGNNSIYALEKKNTHIFKQKLKDGKLEIYEPALQKIKTWKEKGLKIAVVSPEENFSDALVTSDIEYLFDLIIERKTSLKMGLNSKPEADLYMNAVNNLGVAPDSSVFIDNSAAGLRAGSKANFGLVVGICRDDNRKKLSENGADIVINSLDELDLFNDSETEAWFTQPILPFASQYVKISDIIYGKLPVLFLDYDGTLTPIVNRPEDAVISDEMRDVLKECASKFTVAAVSGRDMDDLKSKIGLDELIYAGSHGFRISGPDGLYMEHELTREILPRLEQVEKLLRHSLADQIEGVQIERKRYAIAVHYRNSKIEDEPLIRNKTTEIVANSTGIKLGEGKKILEIKPDIDWHKGKAVLWILEKLGLTDNNVYIPVYIGDDITDEDAYEALKDKGIGIQVGPGAKKTSAHFKLKNVYQVRLFLKDLVNYIIE